MAKKLIENNVIGRAISFSDGFSNCFSLVFFKCPFCNSIEYDILRAFIDEDWIDVFCRCEECGETFTLVCQAEKVVYQNG